MQITVERSVFDDESPVVQEQVQKVHGEQGVYDALNKAGTESLYKHHSLPGHMPAGSAQI